MAISAGLAGLIGAAIGAGATLGSTWIQKTRDIEWQSTQREQQGIEDLGRALSKMGQHYVELGESWQNPDSAHRLRGVGHGIRAEVRMLTEFYAQEMRDEMEALDQQIKDFLFEIQTTAIETRQEDGSEDEPKAVAPEVIKRLVGIPAKGAAIRNRCYEMMGLLATLRRERAARANSEGRNCR